MAFDPPKAPPASTLISSSEEAQGKLPRRTLVLSGLGGLAVLVGGYWGMLDQTAHPAAPGASDGSKRRILSLSPGVTDTLFSLNAGQELIAVSDYCRLPVGKELPQVGTALSPRFENIARLKPSLIVTSDVGGDALRPLEKLAPVLSLPWLTLQEWLTSIGRLGEVLKRGPQAQALIEQISRELGVVPPPSAPHVLLSLDSSESGALSTWFIRKNSIHGAVLAASGANNAVDREVLGQPQLSPEELLSIDPDGILILRGSAPDPIREKQSTTHFQKWQPLRAVKEGRIEVISMPGALTVGPEVLHLLPLMKAALSRLFPPTGP